MQIPSYGAAPLATTFLISRALQIVCMLVIIGLTANFVNAITTGGISPPQEIVGALTMTCIGTLYTAISLPYFLSPANLGLLIMAGFDGLLLIAFIVVSVSVGKPLSFTNCYLIKNTSSITNADSALSLVQNLVATIKSGKLDLWHWANATRGICMESKALWGFSISLCILYATTLILLPTLFIKNKRVGSYPIKDVA